ncbi:MAG: helix-turn-helix transcriptional regulator [Pontiella sp.]|nr:helix-turn-helix transcriptional regulator [Pontiella sp.]
MSNTAPNSPPNGIKHIRFHSTSPTMINMKLAPPVNFRNLSHEALTRTFETNTRLHEFDPDSTFPEHLYNLLKPSISNIHFCTGLYQLQPFAIDQHENPTIDPRWNVIVEQHALEHYFVQILLEDPCTHLAITPEGTFQSTTLYNEVYTKIQAQHQMWVGINAGNQMLNCIYSREQPYDEKSISMLHLMLPHIELSWKIWERTLSLKNELDQMKSRLFQSEEEERAAANLRLSIEQLTPRQRDVVELVAAGMDNQQIADELGISILTVKKHLQAIFQSMDVQHRTELAAKWHQGYSISIG